MDTDALVITSFAAHRSKSSDTAIPLRLPPGLGQVSLPSLFEALRRTLTGLAHTAHRPDDEFYIELGEKERENDVSGWVPPWGSSRAWVCFDAICPGSLTRRSVLVVLVLSYSRIME
jgi:hypothetical protein